ncbi:clec-49 [Pristionchus pacificus]|nr:clec-49 [Pristionchus pacificus]
MRALYALLLAVFTTETQAFVYTCNEISNTLLPKNLKIPSKFACVVLQDLLTPDTPWLSSIFVKDEASGKQYSLASFSSLTPQPCATGDGPWRVVTDSPSSVDCTYEITLLFSSVPTNLIVVQPHTYEYIRGPGSDLTFVSPRGGISLNWHTQGEVTGYEEITFYTGVGYGPEEDLYPIGSLFTNDMAEGRDTDIFDPVVTVKIPSNISIEIGYDTFADKALNVFGYPGYSVNVLSSGLATTFQEQNTMKVVQASYGRRASVHVTASITFDPSSDHKLKLQAYCGDDICGEKIVQQSTTVDWLLNAEKFRVNYITGLTASQIGKNVDNVFISVVSSRVRCDDDYLQLGDHCYRSSDSFATFSDAEADCVSKGGHLASIHNQDTNTFINQLASGAPIGVFIGMKQDQGVFKWTDGSAVDYNNGHLDSFGGECVIMGSSTETWSNADCDFAFKYICEKNANE